MRDEVVCVGVVMGLGLLVRLSIRKGGSLIRTEKLKVDYVMFAMENCIYVWTEDRGN